MSKKQKSATDDQEARERGDRLVAVAEMSLLAFAPLMDDDQLTFELGPNELVTEVRNGKTILYSPDPSDRPFHVNAVVEHMVKEGVSTWSGAGRDLKLIDWPPLC